MKADDRIIVALDKPNLIECEAMVEKLGDSVNFYKIGLGMLCEGGLGLAIELKNQGKRVFLDMKFFDIGATVEKAVRGLIPYNLDFLTVHGDPYVVQGAFKGRGDSNMKILAVTFLTSLNRADLDRALIKGSINNNTDLGAFVIERARLAFLAGADGVIASPHEAAAIRALPEAKGKLIVTPGVRPAGRDMDDQKRIATPAQAIQNGANHIVIGRPILEAENPRGEILKIIKELNKPKFERKITKSWVIIEQNYSQLEFGEQFIPEKLLAG